MPPSITLEEHFLADCAENLRTFYSEQLKDIPQLTENLADIGPLRLASMDQNRISIQIVSHAPGIMTGQQHVAANDQLAGAVKANPDRFRGFASLPMSAPDDAAKELIRCVRELGFLGALVNNRTENTYYDGAEYDGFWRTAQELDVPVYLHPTFASDEQNRLMYTGNFSRPATMSIGGSGWGWHSDVAVHILRLFAAGTFDKFPQVKIIAGHMGEMLPFMLHRIMQLSPRMGKRDRPFKEVYDTNIWITTSGVWSIDPMATILRNTKIERILYSVDYPFAKNENGLIWLKELEASGMVNQEQLEKIAYKNAQQLFGIKIT